MVMDLNKHIVTDDSSSLFHTSGYAQVANGNNLGAVNTQTFEQRQQIERNRQIVGGYSRSAMGQSYSAVRARPVVSRDMARSISRPRGVMASRPVSGGQPHFSEPQGRAYNPYG